MGVSFIEYGSIDVECEEEIMIFVQSVVAQYKRFDLDKHDIVLSGYQHWELEKEFVSMIETIYEVVTNAGVSEDDFNMSGKIIINYTDYDAATEIMVLAVNYRREITIFPPSDSKIEPSPETIKILELENKIQNLETKNKNLERELRKHTCGACGKDEMYADHISSCCDCGDVFFCCDCYNVSRCTECEAKRREKFGSCGKCKSLFDEYNTKTTCIGQCHLDLCKDCLAEHGTMCEDCFNKAHIYHNPDLDVCNVCKESYCVECSVMFGDGGYCPEGC